MYVCVCNAVTDTEVMQVIESGAESVADVTTACRAGGDCGACVGMIEDMIDDASCSGRRSLPLFSPGKAA